jgi:hypothetical protein
MNQNQLTMIVLAVALVVAVSTAPVYAVSHYSYYTIPTHKTTTTPFSSGQMVQGSIPYHYHPYIPIKHK